MSALADEAQAVAELVLRDPMRGLNSAQALAGRARAAGAAEPLAIALRAAAWAAREVFQHDVAYACLEECIEVADAAGLHDRLVEALMTRAGNHLEVGRTEDAQADIRRAQDLGVPGTQAELSFTEGLITTAIGRANDAIDAYERALDHLAADDPHLEGKVCNNLGMLFTRLGRHDDAEAILDRATRVTREAGGGVLLTVLLMNQAEVELHRGNPAAAMARYGEAESLCRGLGVPLAELYREKAAAMGSMLLLEEAAEAARQAVAEVRRAGTVTLILVDALLTLARTAAARGEHDEAIATAADASRLATDQGWNGIAAAADLVALGARLSSAGPSPGLVAELRDVEVRLEGVGQIQPAISAGLLLAEASAGTGDPASARQAYARTAQRSAAGGALAQLQHHRANAGLAQLAGDTTGALEACGAGLWALDRYRAGVGSSELRARAALHGRALGQIAMEVALETGDPELVWTWMERSRSAHRPTRPTAVDPDVALWLEEIRAVESELLADTDDEDARRSQVRLGILERQVRERLWAEDGTRDALPLVAFEPTTVLPQLHGRALVQMDQIGHRLIAIVATADGARLVDLGAAAQTQSCVTRLAAGLSRLSGTRSPAIAAATAGGITAGLQDLSERLWAPLALDDEDRDEVVVSPPTELMAVPWCAIPGLDRTPTRIVSSVAEWQVTAGRLAASDRVVLVAGPRLDAAADEVRALSAIHAGSDVLTGGSATGSTFLRAAEGAAVVHLACHGHVRTDAPTFSSVELHDGSVTLHELERMATPAHLWILAACDLGGEAAGTGTGLHGVVASLLGGGAGAVLAASAQLPDRAAVPLMSSLHTHLAAGHSLARALWLARQTADTSTPHGFAANLILTCFGGG